MTEWVGVKGNDLPSNAVGAGYETGGWPLYVARAKHLNDWTPGKAGYHLQGCHISYGGQDIVKPEFEVLTYDDKSSESLDWIPCSNGRVPDPDNSFCVQPTLAYFVARVRHKGFIIPGKLHTSHGCTYIPFNGQELSSREYEVLQMIKRK